MGTTHRGGEIPERISKKSELRRYIFIFFFSIIIALLIASYQEVVFLFQILLYAISGLTVLSALGGIVFLFLLGKEKYRIIRASRIEQEKFAHVMVVDSNEETWIRDTNKDAEWKNLTGTPILRINGQEREPTDREMELHERRLLIMNSPKTIENTINQLPAEIEEQPQSLFDLLEAYPHVMLVGGTGSGKTTQMNHCIDFHLKQNRDAKVVWLSTHANLDMSENNIHPKALPFQQPQQITKVLSDLFETYKIRRDNAGQYPKLIICLDEWPEIIDECEEIKAGDILKRMSRGSRKTNISLILASHGANVGDLGIAGHSSVKFDFAEIQLSARMTQQNKAIWINNQEQIEISLPGAFYSYSKPRLTKLPIEKRKEQEWLELVESGMSKRQACLKVFDRQFAGDMVDKLNGFSATTE